MVTSFDKKRIVSTLLLLLTFTALHITYAASLPVMGGVHKKVPSWEIKQALAIVQSVSTGTQITPRRANKKQPSAEFWVYRNLYGYPAQQERGLSGKFDQIYPKAKDAKEMHNKLQELEGQIKEKLNLPVDRINRQIAKQILYLERQRLAVLIAGHWAESAKSYRKNTYYENLNSVHAMQYRHHHHQAYELIAMLSSETYKDYQDFIHQIYFFKSSDAVSCKNKANFETGNISSTKATFMKLEELPWEEQLLAIMCYYARLYKLVDRGELARPKMQNKRKQGLIVIMMFISALEALIVHMVALVIKLRHETAAKNRGVIEVAESRFEKSPCAPVKN